MDTATIRHLLATIAYRAAKVLRDAPPAFGSTSPASSVRPPVQIVAHMGDLMDWGLTIARGDYVWKPQGSDSWETEVPRFFAGLSALDEQLATGALPEGAGEKLIQGPLADALTHVGQLAMLRGIAGAAIRPESYAKAEIVAGRVGLDQAAPRREFDGDASARK
jgi:hypothetical protein